MARSKKPVEVEEVILGSLEESPGGAFLGDSVQSLEAEEALNEPLMTDLGWDEFVLSKFDYSELHNGNPKVNGLRRVARLLLGPIQHSLVRTVQAPAFLADNRTLCPAVVECEIRILMTRLDGMGTQAYPMTFSEVADAFWVDQSLNNVNEFVRMHLVATAATKAEARALRKALCLNKCSAEEICPVPMPEVNANGLASPETQNTIDILMRRCDVNGTACLFTFKEQYTSLKQLPERQALKLLEKLSSWQNDRSKVPEGIRGYKEGWVK